METKVDLIIEAYGDSWHNVKNFVDLSDGWCTDDYYHKIDCPTPTKSGYNNFYNTNYFRADDGERMVDVYQWRPRSLEGIEDNNGWEILNENSDIQEDEYVLFLRMTEGGEVPIFTSVLSDDFEPGYFTHYKRIDISKPPLYIKEK